MARRKTTLPVWLRRFSQAAFFILFLYLFLQAAYHPINRAGARVDFFFHLDPLVLLSSWLASHKVTAGWYLGLLTVIVTLMAGRWFCGWVCPFGTLHQIMSSARASRAKDKLTVGGYSRWQKSKYYLLFALLIACSLGLNLTGWFDPLSFLYRSLATFVYPMVNDLVKSVFGWIYQADPGIGPLKVNNVTEPVYEVLRRHFLAVAPLHFYGTVLLVLIFSAVLFLNLYRARFWCRYICPLGGLLGVIGKNPLVQLKQNREVCNDCRLCVAECQGGANPDSPMAWKPSECVYCWNCHSACPQHGITFAVHVPGGKK